ncbi:MAG: hypothetical protein R3315_12400 [Woeseiaceae bacterium]|nr:hypothetical protein [Woeseiaceae bacterium]
MKKNNNLRVTGNSGRHIVFTHGRGCKPAPNVCLDIFFRALATGITADAPDERESLGRCTRSIAYYGDFTNELLTSADESYDEQLDVNDLENSLNELAGIDRKKGFGVKNYDRLPGKSAAREFAVSLFAPLVESIGLGKKVVAGRHKDLAEYWTTDGAYREAVLTRVRDAIVRALNADDNVILVSHGTGSIVAWDALWQLSHDPNHVESCRDLKLDLWITLGAPLGDELVKKQLLGADRKGRERYPTNVIAWHNVSAEDDYMSHDNTVGDDFRAMLTQRQISSIRDYHIYNMAIRYGRSNPHNVLGYLVHPRVSKIVSDWLRLVDGRALPKAPAADGS